MELYYLYRRPALSAVNKKNLLSRVREGIAPLLRSVVVEDIETEFCFYIQGRKPLSKEDIEVLRWLLSETFEPENLSGHSFLETPESSQIGSRNGNSALVAEVGPRMNFTTSWSTNAVSICHSCGLGDIERIERSRRYRITLNDAVGADEIKRFLELFLPFIHDRMTECHYPARLSTFDTGAVPEPVKIVPLIEEGPEALRRINREMGLGLDEWDIDYYYNLFTDVIGRNPTNVECFDLGQSNSEHSRHWFFKGKLVIDGVEVAETLFDLVSEPYKINPNNSLIAFKDNSSALRGNTIKTIIPERSDRSSPYRHESLDYHLTFTAETHNFPTGVAPFPGAETGTGGRIRDGHATGKGSLVVAGTAAYCVGNLNIPGYILPWEDRTFTYPKNLAPPLDIEIEASNGASDYGNKFGEPLIQGFTRSFGLRMPGGERSEWIKPVMFTGGVGQIDARHTEKEEPEIGMLVVKIGGPAYRIGIGGGAASSMIQGENLEELDFSAVQRGDAEMEQKVNRVLRACVEMGESNPIISIHDQGAGGNCNVVKEIIYPKGAKIEIRDVLLGDKTLSVLEIWGAEYQENDALLIDSGDIDLFQSLCRREKVSFSVLGEITGDGYIILHDSLDGSTPESFELEKVLGKMPQKTFKFETPRPLLKPLLLPEGATVRDALDRVLRLLSVGSKRFLTSKVDRSVTGLIVQQQCAGPLHLTLSNVSVIAQSHFAKTGAAISIGEQPIKGLISPSAMARMSVGEALTNMVWAKITALEDIKFSGNWMWAAKLPGEGARLYEAAVALRDILVELGAAIDGGKDSLSMATLVNESDGSSGVVKSPGSIVMSAYAACPDIASVLTPDIRYPGKSRLIYIDLGEDKYRLGGTALGHVYGEIGDEAPDLDNPALLKSAFSVIQRLISDELILSGHDRSDGGLITTLLEMAFGGNCGLDVGVEAGINDPVSILFSEELGLVIEYLPENEGTITDSLEREGIPYQVIAKTIFGSGVRIRVNGAEVLNESMPLLREAWEETSYKLDLLQADPESVEEERRNIYRRPGPSYKLTFVPEDTPPAVLQSEEKPKVAIVREEGSNSDREMASAFYQAGFDVWDITMTDLTEGSLSLDKFRGVAFVGGFSYADVLDSAKGWAGVIRFNTKLSEEFERFYQREDTFSLGVCNGCQLMALLGWVPWREKNGVQQPRFIHNRSGRFESRFSAVKILESPSIMLKGMEGSVLGVWVAHGEGRAYFPDKDMMGDILDRGLAPLRYVDDASGETEAYPFNPNGSPKGITALCSPDGRHLAMMPHPERTFLKWQWAWMPEEWRKTLNTSPWLRIFQNAREWCG